MSDCFQDACYLISKFNYNNKSVNQLQVQRLMYLFEALYCICKNKKSHYDFKFKAWAFGPVSVPLHKELKQYDGNIILTNDDLKLAKNVSKEKKIILDRIYEVFGDLSPEQLINLTCDTDGAWYKVWAENNKEIKYEANIPLIESKRWFKSTFMSNKRDNEKELER